MSTIQDLNTARTITYNDEANYAIVFGANAGNITANVDSYATANITQQTTLTSITSPVRDLLLDVQFSNVGNVSMAYTGTYSNIGLLQVAPAAWRVNGIRSVNQYTEAFANVKFTDLTGASNITPEYSYVTTVNDQAGNTRAWTTTVNVIQQPTVSITGNVIYNEDTLANVTIANVVVDPTSIVTFRLYANTAVGNGTMTDGVVTGNSIFIDGNATSLNTQIAAGAFKFLPASDLASNVGNAITFAIGNTTAIFSTANANIQIANTHAEYNFPDGTYIEDTKLAFGNTITDLDTRALSFTVGIQQTAGNAGVFYQSNVAVAGNANTQLNITNSRAAINNTIEWLPPADYVGNVSFTYNQVKTLATGNVTQASNVVATFTSSNSNPEIGNMIARSYTSNVVNNIFSSTTPYINDGPDYGQSYTVTLASPIGKFGNSAANAIAAASYSYTGNITLVNNEFTNMKFVPNYGAFAGNSTFTYTQVRSGVTQANTTLTLTGTESTLSPLTKTYITATTDKTLTPTFAQSYWQRAEILMVAGGGGGGGDSSPSAFGQGGGGAGRVVTLTGVQLPQELITITIGAGGNGNANGPGSTGGSTSYSSGSGTVSVGGGGGGFSLAGGGSNDGGTSGNLFAGGSGGASAGGGGGGSSGVGGNGSGSTRGVGGPGTYSTISGANVVYGNGGGGGNISTQGVTSTTYGGGGGGGSQLADGLAGTAGIVIIKIS